MRHLYRTRQLTLVIGDLICFVLGFWLTILVRFWQIPTWANIDQNIGIFSVIFVFWLAVNYINGLFDLAKNVNSTTFFRRIAESATFSLITSVIFFYLWPETRITPKTILVLNIIFGYSLVALWRFIHNQTSKKTQTTTNILIFGLAEETAEIAKIISDNPEKGYKVCSIIDTSENKTSPENAISLPSQITIYRGLENTSKIIADCKPAIICMAPHLRQNSEVTKELYKLLFSDCLITDALSLYETITGKINLRAMTETWFLENLKKTDNQIFERTKTILDYLAGIITGVVFLVLFVPISLAIKLNSSGSIFYKQKRMGQDGKIFNLYKFRSMYSLGADGSAEQNGAQFASKKDSRVTAVGKILRKTRLDELPQFWNLLKRDITLVGPRPERPEIVKELEQKMPYYSVRHIVKPGLIGWALIHQNYADNYDSALQKLQYDLYYIKNRSWLLDVVIFLRSINILIRFMGQ